MSLRRPTVALLLFSQFPLEESFRPSFGTSITILQFPLEASFRPSLGTQYFTLNHFNHTCALWFLVSFRDRRVITWYSGACLTFIIPVFLMFASTFKRTHWLVPGYCLGQIPRLEISIAVTTSEPTRWRVQPREDRSYPGQLFLWEMESHRRRCFQPLPPTTIRNRVLYSLA